jgi:hypothetical protein
MRGCNSAQPNPSRTFGFVFRKLNRRLTTKKSIVNTLVRRLVSVKGGLAKLVEVKSILLLHQQKKKKKVCLPFF